MLGEQKAGGVRDSSLLRGAAREELVERKRVEARVRASCESILCCIPFSNHVGSR